MSTSSPVVADARQPPSPKEGVQPADVELLRRGGNASGGRGMTMVVLAAVGVALFAVFAVAGFFIGRDTAPTKSVAAVDTTTSSAIATQLSSSNSATGAVHVSAASLVQGDPETQSLVSGLLAEETGSSDLAVNHASVDRQGSRVIVNGTANVNGVDVTSRVTVDVVAGKSHVVMEHVPHAKVVSLTSATAADAGLPDVPLNGTTTVFVMSSSPRAWTFAADSPFAGRRTDLTVGTNVVSRVRLSDLPVMQDFFSTTQLADDSSRRRRLVAGTPWASQLHGDVTGSPSSAVSVALGDLQTPAGLVARSMRLALPSHATSSAYTAHATISLPTLPAFAPVTASGAATNSSVALTGVGGAFTAGSGVGSVPIAATAVTLDVTAGTEASAISGTMFFSGAPATVSIEVPPARRRRLAGTPSAHTLTLSNVTLADGIVLTNGKITANANLPSTMTATVAVATGLPDTYMTFTCTGSVSTTDGVSSYSLTGSAPDVTLATFNTATVVATSLSLSLSGKITESNDQASALSGSVSGSVSLGGQTLTLSLALPHSSASPMTFALAINGGGSFSIDGVKNIICDASCAAVPTTVASTMDTAMLSDVVVSLTTTPVTLSVAGKLLIKLQPSAAAATEVAVKIESQRNADKSWGYAVGFAVDSPFELSALVPSKTDYDFVTFESGAFVVSTTNTTFTFSGDSGMRLSATTGVSFGFQLGVDTLAARMVSPSAWAAYSTLRATGAYTSAPEDLTITVSLPEGLPVTTDIFVRSGDVTLTPTAPQYSLAASCDVNYSSTAAPLVADLSGDLTGESYTLTATVTNWDIGASDKGVTVDSASLTLTGTKDASSGNWTATGTISGDATFGSVVLKAVIDLPITKDHVDIQVPDLQLNKDVRLTDIAVTDTGSSFRLDGTANITFSAMDNLVFSATAEIINDDISVSGTINKWTIGGADGVVCTDVDFSVSGKYDASSGPQDLTGALTGKANFIGVNVDFTVDLPMVDDGKLQLQVAHIDFGHNVELDTVALTVQRAEPQYALAAQATIGTGLKNDDLQLAVSGWLIPSAGNFTVAGTMANWDISSDFSIANLAVNVTGTRKAGAATGTDLSGSLTGEMKFDDITVDVEAGLPTDALSVSFPTLRLGKDVTLKDVSMTVTGASPSFTFDGTLTVDTKQPTPLTMTASGHIDGSSFSLTGTLSSWTVEVGADDFTVSGLSVSISEGVGAKTFAGSLTGTLAFGSLSLDMTVALPGSAEGGLKLDLTLKAGDTLTVGDAISASCGDVTMKAPSSMATSVKAAAFKSATIQMETSPASLTIAGTVDVFGKTDLSAKLVASSSGSPAKWNFGLGVAITDSFGIDTLVSGAGAWNFIEFSKGGVVISSTAQQFSMPSDLGTVSATDGVTVDADIPLTRLSQELAVVGKWSTVESVDVTGSFGLSTDALVLSATLPPNLPLGSNLELNATVSIATSEPHFSLSASTAFTIAADQPPVLCTADVSYDAAGKFHISASAASYMMAIGKDNIEVKSVSIVADDTSGTLSGTFTGLAQFADGLELNMTVAVPAPSGGDFSVSLALLEGKTATAKQLVDAMCGTTAISGLSVPSDFSSIFSTSFLGASITLSADPWAITAKGKMSLFHVTSLLDVELEIKQQDADWHFGVGVGLGPDFKLGDVMPSVASDTLDAFDFSDGAIVVSTFPSAFSFTIPNANTAAVSVTDGVALSASIDLSQGHLAAIKSWTGIDSLVVSASFGLDTKAFTLTASIDTDWTIDKVVDISQASLILQVGGSLGLDIGVGCHVGVKTSTQTLQFRGTLKFSEDTMAFTAGMTTPWVSPFGVNGLTIGDTEFELGISYALVPDLLGFSGSLTIDGVSGGATVFLDIADPTHNVIAANLPSMHLGGLIDAVTDVKLPAILEQTVGDVGFHSLDVAINLGTTPLTFNNQTFQPGFKIQVADLMLPFFGLLEKSTTDEAASNAAAPTSRRRLSDAGQTRRLQGMLLGGEQTCSASAAGAGSGSGSGAGSDTGSGSGSATGSGSGSGSGSATGSDTGSATGSDTGSDTGANSGTTDDSGTTDPSTGGNDDGSGTSTNRLQPTTPVTLNGISAEIDISQSTGVLVKATMAPMGWGKVFSLSGAQGPDSPAELEIKVGDALAEDMVRVSGAVKLLDVLNLEAFMDISDEGFDVNVTLDDALLDVVLALSYKNGSTTFGDVSLYADINEEMLANITESLSNSLKSMRDSFDSRVSSAKSEVDKWEKEKEPTLKANEAEIAKIKADDTKDLSSVQKDLYDAQQKLASAESTVNSLQTSINNDEAAKQNCEWYDAACDAHNTWLDTKIAALWTAMHAADAALDVAQAAVKTAKEAVEKSKSVLPKVDPRVLALETEDAAIEAAKKVADGALDAAEKLVDGATDLMQWALSDFANAFKADNAFIKADSMLAVDGGAQLEFGVSALLFGKVRSFDLKIDFPPSASGLVSAVWSSVKEDVSS